MRALSELTIDIEVLNWKVALSPVVEATDYFPSSGSSTILSSYKKLQLSQSAANIMHKIYSFGQLMNNWDGEGALAPTKSLIEEVNAFVIKADSNNLPFYFTAPGPNGEIVVEFKNGSREAGVYFHGSTTVLVLNELDSIFYEGPLAGSYARLLSFMNT
jgi:hypothetical protein